MSSHISAKVLGAILVAMALLVPLASTATATNYTWCGDLDPDRNWDANLGDDPLVYYNWVDAGDNYASPLPPGVGDTVEFKFLSTDPHNLAPGNVDLNGDRTVDGVTFSNASESYTLRPSRFVDPGYEYVASTLTTASINQTADAVAAINEIAAGVVGNGGAGNDLNLTVSAGSLAFTGRIGTAGTATNVIGTVAGGATLRLAPTDGAGNPNNITGTIVVAGEMRTQMGGLGSATAELDSGTLTILGGQSSRGDPGLIRKRFDAFPGAAFPYSRWDELATATPTEQVIDDVINDDPNLENYTMTWEGYLYAPRTGAYNFQTNSDDEGWLDIDTGTGTWTTVVHTNVNTVAGTIVLAEGFHKFRFGYAEGGGGDYGRVWWDAGLGGAFQFIDSGSDADPNTNFYTTASLPTMPYVVGGSVVVKGDSTVNVDGVAVIDALTLHGGSTLNVRNAGAAPFPGGIYGFESPTTAIDDTTPGTVTVDVAADMPFRGGALTLGTVNNTLTKTGDGTATFTTVTHPTNGGTFTVNADRGELALTGRLGDDTNSIDLAASVPTGGKLRLADPTNNVTGTATVSGGRLVLAGTDGKSALGTGKIVLNGGNLDLNTVPLDDGKGLTRNRYDTIPGAAFPYSRWADLETAVPSESVTDYVINYSPNLEGYTVTWEGYIYTAETRTYRFQSGSDDEGWLEIDNGKGWVLLGHPVVNDKYGQITLDAGFHKFRFGYAEGGGGDWGHVLWDAGLGGAYQIIDSGVDADQGTNYYRMTTIVPAYLGNDVDVTASSTISADNGAILGTLKIDNGVILTTNVTNPMAYVAFETTEFTNVGAGAITFETNGETRLGKILDNGNEIGVIKSGGGALVLDNTEVANPSSAAMTTFRVDSGTLAIVGEFGGADPLGGAMLIMDAPASIVLSSKGGDADIGTTIDINADVALTAKRAYSGTETGVKVNLTGAIDIQAGQVLSLATEDGYALSINTTPTGGGSISVADDSVGEIGPGGSTANVPMLSMGARARFNITTATGLDADTVVNIGPDSFFDIQVAQDPGYFPNEINVASFGALGGNLTGVDFGGGAGAQNVFLNEDSVLAVDPAIPAFNPTRAQMGDQAILWVGIVDLAGNYQDLGDAGPGSTSVYKGAAISDAWTPFGDFVGTLSEAAGADGFAIGLRRDQQFGTPGGASATFDATAGHEIAITGEAKMIIGAPLAGTADTFVRRGTAPLPYDVSRGTMGKETLEFGPTADLLTGGRTMTVQNGGVYIDQDTDMRRAVSNGSTLNIGPWSGLVLRANPQTGSYNIRAGADDGAGNPYTSYVYSNAWDRLLGGAAFTFDNGSFFMYDYDDFRYTEHGLPLDKSVNIIINREWGLNNPNSEIRLGDGALLTAPYNRSWAIYDHFGAPSKGISLTDPNGDGADPTVNSVRIGKPNDGNGSEFIFNTKIDLRNNRTVSDASRAHLYIGAAPGTEPWLPSSDVPGASDWASWRQMPLNADVVFRSGIVGWNEDGLCDVIAGDITIESGRLRIGDSWDALMDINLDINGEITTKSGGTFFLAQRPATPQAQLLAGTLGTRHILENGGRAEYQLVHTDPGYITMNEPLVFRAGDNPGARSQLYFDVDEGMSGGDIVGARGYYVPNVRMEQGADVAVSIANIDQWNMRWELTMAGDARITRNGAWSGPSYTSITAEADPGGDGIVGTPDDVPVRRTLIIGARTGVGADWMDFSTYGALSDYLTIDLQNAGMDIRPGTTLADASSPGGGTIVNSWGNQGNGEDSHIRVFAGADGSGFSGGTFNFSGYQDLVLRVDDAEPGQPRIVNEMTSPIYIYTTFGGAERWSGEPRGAWVHAWLQVGRAKDTAGLPGVGYFKNINLGEGAQFELERWDDGDLRWKGDINLLGRTGGVLNWNNDNENELCNLTGTKDEFGNNAVLEVGGWSRVNLTGTITDLNIDWTNTNCMQVERSDTGPEMFNPAPGTVIRTVGGQWTNGGCWSWGDILCDTGAVTFENMLGWPKFGNDRASTNWWQEDWRSTYYVYYGGSMADQVGENGWGADTTYNLSGGSRVSLRVEVPDTWQPNEINKLDARINVYDTTWEPDAMPPGWREDCDARLLSGWQYNQRNNNWGAWSHFSNVHIYEGAMVRCNTDWTTILVDLVMEGNGRILFADTNEAVVGTVNGSPDTIGEGIKTLTVLSWNWTRYQGVIGGNVPVNVVAGGAIESGQDWIQFRPGFAVAPGSRWIQGKDDMRIVIQGDIATTSGGGIIDLTRPVAWADNWDWDEGSMRFEYGMENTDLNGDNGHGSGQVFEVGGKQKIRTFVDDSQTPGTFNVNKVDSTFRVVNNSDGRDAMFIAWRQDDNASGIWAKAQYSDIRIVEEGAEIMVQTVNGAYIETDITLEANGRISNWDSPDREIIKVTAATEKTLTIDTHSGDAGWWSTPQIDLTVEDQANAEFDVTGGGAVRLMGLHLNGRTLTVKRTSAQGPMLEMWPECNTDPNGLIDIVGMGQGVQVRMANEGGVALQTGTRVQISNNQVLGGFVQERDTEAIQEIQANVKIMASGSDTDGIIRSVKSDVRDDGETPGMVKLTDVTMADGSKAELQANDNTKMWLANVALEGNAEIWQNSTQNRISIGNVSGAGALTVGGNGWTNLVGNLASTINVTGWVMLADTSTIGGGINVDNGGVLIVNSAMAGDGINVNAGGVLAIGNAGFTPGTMTIQNGGAVALVADLDWTDTANALGQSGIMIAKEGYDAQLTLNSNFTAIGAEWTDRASIVTPLAGTATQVNLMVPGTLLTIGDGVLTDFSGNATAVNIDRDVRMAGDATYTGDTNILSGRTVTLGETSLGGAVGGGTNVLANATLDVLVDLIETSVTVVGPVEVGDVGGTVSLHGNLTTGYIALAGGTVAAEEEVTVTGAVIDAADMTLQAAAGRTLTFTGGPALTANRQWTVPSGTVAFQGDVGTDGNGGGGGGRWDLAKLGAGTLRLAGASGVNTLTIGGGGGGGGGMVVVDSDAALPTLVLINSEAAYGVGADHGYAEVDMLNSVGCIAIGADTSKDLAMQNALLSLGASSDAVYSGTLTPFDDGANPVYYQLGGGGGTLTVQSALVEGTTLTDVRIGRQTPGTNDITHQGMVILDGDNTFAGYLDIYGYAGITKDGGDPMDRIASATGVRVFKGGSLDLGGAAVPMVHTIDLTQGGGVSSNDYTLTVDDISNLFVGASEIVIGGGLARTGVTTVADGALVGPVDFRKIGPNEVVLEDVGASANNGIYSIAVEGGTLTVTELSSLGLTGGGNVTLTNDATLNVATTGTTEDMMAVLQLGDTATMQIGAGQTVMASGLGLVNTSARVRLAGGGTLNIGNRIVGDLADNGAQIEIADGSTLIARYGNEANQAPNLFRIRSGSTLRFDTADWVNMGGGQMQSIGWMDAGATLEFGPDLDQGTGQWQTIYGNPGLTLDVDPLTYDEGTAPAPYTIRVGEGTRIDFWNGSGTNSLRSASFTDATGIPHKPVAYIRLEGDGKTNVYGGAGFDAGDTNAARIFHWTVGSGTLETIDEAGLGADAHGWVFNDKRASIANQHLEGITVEGGATLIWAGTHGFLSPDAYRGMPAEQGNGFVAGDFVLKGGSTLRGNNLTLGFQQTYTTPGATDPTDTYLCYPTITGDGSTDITLGGTIRFNSGIARSGTGAVNVTVTDGEISLIDRLNGAIGTDVINTLTQQTGTTRIGNNQTNMASTTINAGTLMFQPTGSIAYNGDVTLNSGYIQAASGTTDLGNTVVQATAAAPTYDALLLQEFYDGLDGVTGPGGLLAPLMGAGFNPYTPAFWKIGGRLDYPGNGDSFDPAQPWYEPDGSITLDHAGNPIVMADSDQIGFRATGELMIDTPGLYSFSTRSDDGNKLWIDGQVVVDNDYWQGFTERTGSIQLEAGPHTIAFGFYEGGGGAGFDVRWDPSGGSNWAAIPTDKLRYVVGTGSVDGIMTVQAPAILKARGVQGLNRLVVDGKLVLGEATSMTRELYVGSVGNIDLTNGNLVVDYNPVMGSPFDAVVTLVKQGLGTGRWDGTTGISSSVAAWDSDPTNEDGLGTIGIAVAENNDPELTKDPSGVSQKYANLEAGDGVALDASSVLVKVTYWGDANLDGVVDANDYDLIDRNFLFTPDVVRWVTGDFNYDGVIDANDYDKIDRAFLFQGDPMSDPVEGGGSTPAPMTTPEPATMALLGLGALAALVSRRRSR